MTARGAPAAGAGQRVLIVYDCLYPWSIGGAERWYRALAERLAAEGHQVSYITLRQWPPGAAPAAAAARETDGPPAIPGVSVLTAGPRLALYQGARRRLWPPLRFGLGVAWHLLGHGHRYDVVHTASFPYWPLLAAAALQRRGGYRLLTDWWEVWTLSYWRSYTGRVVGTTGWLVQRLCLRLPHHAFVFSHLHAARLQAEGHRAPVSLLRGVYAGPLPEPGNRQRAAGDESPAGASSGPSGQDPGAGARSASCGIARPGPDSLAGGEPADPTRIAPTARRPDSQTDPGLTSAPDEPATGPSQPLVTDGAIPDGPFILYAGRHIPEKRVPAIVPALAVARASVPSLTAVITGDGLTRQALDAAVTAANLEQVVLRPGFVSEAMLDRLYRAALCVVLPSRREGYGLIVVEAAARGTPSVVVAGPDNAATELIEPGVNGFIAASAGAAPLASAMLDVYRAGPTLRASTAAWFAANAPRLSLAGSLARVSAAYRTGSAAKDDASSCLPPSSPA